MAISCSLETITMGVSFTISVRSVSSMPSALSEELQEERRRTSVSISSELFCASVKNICRREMPSVRQQW